MQESTWHRPGYLVRVLYAAALLAPFPGILVLSSGWLGLMTGASLGGGPPYQTIVLLALAVYRAGDVLLVRSALDSRQRGGGARFFRGIGIIGMCLGAWAAAGLFFIKSLALAIFGQHGGEGAGIAALIIALYLGAGTSLAWPGLVAYEIGRFIGSPIDPEERGTVPSRKIRAAIAVALAGVACAAIFWNQRYAAPPCGEDDLAACAAKTEGGVERMVVSGPQAPVVLRTSIERIELRRMSGDTVKWQIVESPRASLREAGTTLVDGDSPIHVDIDARAVGKGVDMTFVVTDSGAETARFVTRFPVASFGGRLLVVDVPVNAVSGMRHLLQPASADRKFVPDHVFVMARQAFGTELEIREKSTLVEREARRVEPPADMKRGAPQGINYVDPACEGRVSKKFGSVHAPSADFSKSYDDVFFAANPSPGPHAYTLRGAIACGPDEVWIVDYGLLGTTVLMRRYAPDGTLLRNVKTSLPPAPHEERTMMMVDVHSISEKDGKIRFARVRGRFPPGVALGLEEVSREVYEVTL